MFGDRRAEQRQLMAAVVDVAQRAVSARSGTWAWGGRSHGLSPFEFAQGQLAVGQAILICHEVRSVVAASSWV